MQGQNSEKLFKGEKSQRYESAMLHVDAILEKFGSITHLVSGKTGIPVDATRDEIRKHFLCASRPNQHRFVELYESAAYGNLVKAPPKPKELSAERYGLLFQCGKDNDHLTPHQAILNYSGFLSSPEEEQAVTDGVEHNWQHSSPEDKDDSALDQGSESQELSAICYRELFDHGASNFRLGARYAIMHHKDNLNEEEEEAVRDGVMDSWRHSSDQF